MNASNTEWILITVAAIVLALATPKLKRLFNKCKEAVHEIRRKQGVKKLRSELLANAKTPEEISEVMEKIIQLDRQEEYLERRKSAKSQSDYIALFEDFPDVSIKEDPHLRLAYMLAGKANSLPNRKGKDAKN